MHNPFLMGIMLPYNPIASIVVVLDQVEWRVALSWIHPKFII